jgi:hypothetical protein
LTIEASAMGHVRAREALIATSADEAMLEIALSRGSSIHGIVALADGVTPAVAQVSLLREGAAGADTTFADEQGRFEFTGKEPDRYRINAQSPLGRARERPVTVGDDKAAGGVVLLLETEGTVRGHVYGLREGEKDRTSVTILKGQTALIRSHVESDGGFVLQGLSPGPMDVVVETPLGRRAAKSVDLPELGSATVDFHLEGGARLFGQIVRNGKTVDAVELRALPLDGQACRNDEERGRAVRIRRIG